MLGKPLGKDPSALGLVDRGVVQNHRQRLVHLLPEPAQKANKHICRRVLPILGAEHLAAREQRRKDVQALAPLGLYQVTLPALRPSAAVGVHRREARFVQVSQLDVSTGRLLFEALYLYGCLAKGVFIAAFFKE